MVLVRHIFLVRYASRSPCVTTVQNALSSAANAASLLFADIWDKRANRSIGRYRKTPQLLHTDVHGGGLNALAEMDIIFRPDFIIPGEHDCAVYNGVLNCVVIIPAVRGIEAGVVAYM